MDKDIDKYKIESSKEATSMTKKSIYKKYIIFIITILIIVFIILITVTRNNKYEEALKKIEIGEYETAYKMLENLGGQKAINKLKDNKYERANEYLKENDEISALILFNELLDYKDSQKQKDDILQNKEYLKMFISKEGDEITFGRYEQDNNNSNGKEKLEWIIIYNNNKKVYMVSKYIIDAMQYNTANGDGSTLKKWLMENFVNETFNDEEKGSISHVGLLNREDMKQYSKIINSIPKWTEYAMAQKPTKGYYAGYSWWLTGEYFHGFATTEISMDVVIESGSFSSNVASVTDKNGVRPAIIIDLNDDNIDYYADDYDDIENSGVVTRTEADANREVKNILGEDSIKQNNSSNSSNFNKVVCPRCNGRGKYRVWNRKEETQCSSCAGTGYRYK